MKEQRPSRLIWFSVLVFSITSGCDVDTLIIKSPSSTNGKPDLTISQVTYTRLPNCIEGYPSGILCSRGRFQFTLTIWNIGDAVLAKPFYIFMSQSSPDIRDSICSSGRLVNDWGLSIWPGHSLEITAEQDF